MRRPLNITITHQGETMSTEAVRRGELMQPMITLRNEKGEPVTVTLQAAFNALVQHLVELRRDLLATQLEVKRLTTPPDRIN
jgi:hypothetical protein